MTATTPETTALADLDVDLSEDVPCMALTGCDRPADQRATGFHTGDGTVCFTVLLCAPHSAEVKAQVAQASLATCEAHTRVVELRWQPLHPGRR